MCNILIADDHPVVLFGTKTFLEQKKFQITATCSSGLEAYNQIVARQPDIALLDMNMPGMTGMEILEKTGLLKLKSKIILLTMYNELSLFNKAKELGVMGYLLKEFAMDELEKCLWAVKSGRTYFSEHLDQKLTISNNQEKEDGLKMLTFAERKILELIAQQKPTKEIAALLFIAEKTVETHRSHIIKKLNLPATKNALLIYAMKMRM